MVEQAMNAPPEFDRLAHCFYQDSREDYPDRTAWIAMAIGVARFDDKALAVLKAFMDKLLAESNDVQLEQAWREADANYGFWGPGAMRRFLAQVRRMLDEPRASLQRLAADGRKNPN
jgi:hypothetical protein